ncbi:MAG: tetratricopeptide repeat protein [Planctomycetes bacterium]|nr:tetratricopeptide repeat protein [Planctomycetota bacterium]
MNDWYEAESRVEKAHQLAESRRWPEALSEIEAALKINPEHGTWQAHRGYILDQLERFDEAIDAYRLSARLDPSDVDVFMALGIDLARTLRCEEAIEALERAERLDPEIEASYCYRILAYCELGDHEKAEEMFYLAQQIKDDCPVCFYHIGGSLAARGQFDRAIYCWNRTLDIDPAYRGAKQSIALAYKELGKLDRAREYFLAEIREDPGNVDLLFDVAELEMEASNPSRSASKLQQIVELEPDYAQAHFSLGEVMLDLDKPNEALEALRTAQELDPDLPRLNLRTGQALFRLAKYAEAARHLSSAHREDQDDDSALLAWGGCLLRLESIEEAAQKFQSVLDLDDTSSQGHHNLAVCRFLQGRHDDGLVHVMRAIELNPCDLAAMHKAVLVLMHLRRWSDARSMIDRAITIDPNDSALCEIRDRMWKLRLRSGVARIHGWIKKIFRRA